MKKRLLLLDISKLLMAFFILTIHYGFFDLGEDFKKTLPRIAVPFFFIITGFFFYHNDTQQLDTKYYKILKKMILIAILSVSFYVMFDLIRVIKNNGSTVDFFRTLFSKENLKLTLIYQDFYINVHLWYILSYPIAITLTYIVLKFKNNNYFILFLCTALLVINLIFGNYSNLVHFDSELALTRNAYFCAFPFILVGCLIKKNNHLINKKLSYVLLIMGIIMFVMQYYENLIFSNYIEYRHSDLYISTIISSICLFIGIINIKITSSKFYLFFDKNIPLLIYILQKFINTKCWEIKIFHPIMDSAFQPVFLFIILYIVSFILCKIYSLIINRYNNRIYQYN